LLVKFLKSGASLFLEYRNAFIPTEQARNIASTINQILSSVLTNPVQRIRDVDLLSERNRLQIEKWNATPLEHVQRTVHDIIIETADKVPQDQAVCAWDGTLSYGELVDYASKFAVRLIELGVGAEVVVPLCVQKSKWNVVATLGVLLAGGCCKFVLCFSPRFIRLFPEPGATLSLHTPSRYTPREHAASSIYEPC
ncbi:acetyl-CoA synthetase-like protein, partial [Byssothecium circinans]